MRPRSRISALLTPLLVAHVLAACVADPGAAPPGVRGTTQAVAGPAGVTVTVRAVDQLAVSWTAVPTAVKYYVFQSVAGAPLAFAASILDSSGGAPPTSYIATGISSGVGYCYAVSAVFPDGTESDLSTGCGPDGTPSPLRSVRVTVPLLAAGAGSVFPARFLATSGSQGVSVQLPSLPVGAIVTEVDARVRDNLSGPTKVVLALAEQVDDGFVAPVIPPTAPSAGTGAFQTLALVGLHRPVQALHTYYAGVFVDFATPGTAPCLVSAIDVTYLPPQ